MKTMHNNRSRAGGFTLVELLVVIAIIAALAGLATPAILRAKKSADLTEATNNLRNLGVFLFAFEDEFGSFPSDRIRTENQERFKNASSQNDSNSLLGLLLAGGFTESEEVFYAKGGAGSSKKPDNIINSPDQVLEEGECGFGYVMLSGDEPMSTSDNGGRPLLVAPLERNSRGDDPEFNPNPYNSRAVYLRIDQSVKQNQIGTDSNKGKVLLPGSKTLFETGEDTVWDQDQPDVKAPR
jgi:prepilin-type N-terminal cleavage/methylation domain-containing protein